ncbi:MAG TPA: RluA family pseudouridine synthase [Candidatus Saccharimonadales bacterium]
MRLDAYVAEYWPEHSRSTWQKYIKAGYVTVNGETITSTKYELGEDDEVKVNPPKQPDFTTETLPILYEDENVTVIDKPEGVLTHAKGALLEEFTVADFMHSRFSADPRGNAERGSPHTGDSTNPTEKSTLSDRAQSQIEETRAAIVHRLDRDTSGVLICARNPEAHSFLQKQFSLKKAKKNYLAILDGEPNQPEALLRLPIERNPKAPATFRVGANGKPAETAYRVLWTNGQHTLVELQPLTGRTHQLRVHMKYIGTPIMNDRFYNPKKPSGRLALHALKLEITIPGGDRKIFSAAVGDDFKALLPPEALSWLPD